MGGSESAGLLAAALASFEKLRSYRVTLRAEGPGFSEAMGYWYMSGHVRIEFIKPHKGAVLTYSPVTREARLRPIGFLSAEFTLDPGNPLIRSSGGHRIDESDLGSLLRSVDALERNGQARIIGDDAVGRRKASLLSVEGNNGFAVENIHRYLLWLDKTTMLPLKVRSFDRSGSVIEEILMDDLETDVEIPAGWFDQ